MRRSPPQIPMMKYIGIEHDFPHHVEQEEVARDEDAEHAGREDQHQRVIRVHLRA